MENISGGDFGQPTVLPANNEAEQSVLGAVLLDSECLNRILDIVRPEYFYNENHREIFSAMHRLFRAGSPVDIITVLNELVGIGVFTEETGKQYLFTLANLVPSVSNVEAYAEIIREKYEMRSLILAAKEIINDASDETNDARVVLDRSEQRIYEIANSRGSQGLKPIGEVLIAAYDHLMLMNSDRRDEFVGTPTGIKTLDDTISGLNKSDLILLAARPGMGKTSFALNIARNVALIHGRKVAFFSLEMTREQLALRMLSTESGVEGYKLRDGRMNPEEWARLSQAASELHGAPIFIDEAGNISVTEMKAKLRRLGDVGLVVIDYLQLMGNGKIANRVQEVSEITRGLKILAKELMVPVLCLSQLNRATESRTGHKPMLSDLRDSGSIEQDADIILFLYREGYYQQSDPKQNNEEIDQSRAVCMVAKNRHGSTCEIPLHWSGATTRFTAAEESYVGG